MCDICEGRGIVVVDGNTAKRCNCMIRRQIINRFKNSKMSKSMLKMTFDKFNFNYYGDNVFAAKKTVEAAKTFVKSVAEGQADGLIITGLTGRGKTYLACCIANELLRKNINTLFCVVPDLLDQIKDTYNKGSEYSEMDLIDTAKEVAVLILDDLGAHQYTEWARSKLFTILNYRINHNLPTVITTNLSVEDVGEAIGDRAASRIIQLCQPYKLEADTDIRVQIRLNKK